MEVVKRISKGPVMFDFEDFFGDESVMLMTHAQVGIYLRLLGHDWHNGSIPSDWALVERLIRLPASEADDFAALIDLIKGKYIDAGEGRQTSRRLQAQRVEQSESYKRAVDRGQKGGKAAAENRRAREGAPPQKKTPAEKAVELLAIAKPQPIRFDSDAHLVVTPEETLRLQNDYPNVDVAGEIRKASNWNRVQSASNRKKKASAFLVNWLNRQRDKSKAAPKGRADANLRNVQARQARLEGGEGGLQ